MISGKRTGPTATDAEHGATDGPAHTTEGDARDSFRGVHLDPKAHHWDDVSNFIHAELLLTYILFE